MYRFIGFKNLFQAEAGMTRNEPQQLCVSEAIESALVRQIVQDVASQTWSLKDLRDWYGPTMRPYLQENQGYAQTTEAVHTPYGAGKIEPPLSIGG